MASQKHQEVAPAYVPWRTFTNFINGLRETGLPSQINRSVMGNLSYSAQAQLLGGMRSLRLIDDQGKPTPILAQLIEADEANQPKIVAKVLGERYGFVFDHLQLDRATPAEVEKQFKEAGITGSTVVRAVAFFLSGAEAAGIPLSAHLKKKNGSAAASMRSSAPRKKRRVDPEKQNGQPRGGQNLPNPPAGFQNQLLGKFPEFDPTWDDTIKKQWFDGFQKLMAMAPTPSSNE
jgi:hypothetical protein